MDIFKKILKLGTRNDLSNLENRYIRLTNYINFCLIFFISIPTTILTLILTDYGFRSYLRFVILICISVFNFFLVSKGKYLIAKHLTVYSPFCLIFVFPIFNNSIKEGMFLWFPFGIMAFGVISFFVFSYEYERGYMNLSVMFYFIMALFFDSVLKKFAPENVNVSFIYEKELNFVHFQGAKVLIVFFLYTSFYKLKIDFYKSQMYILKMNKQLDFLNQELKHLNINLEQQVEERTFKLQLQNQRIKELAFTNSHIIRSFVARILGLIYLTEEPDATNEEIKFCYTKIKENANELDDVTRNLSQDLIIEE